MFSSHTQSTYHNWIRSDYYTLSQFLFIYRKTAQLSDLAYANLTRWVQLLIQLTLPAWIIRSELHFTYTKVNRQFPNLRPITVPTRGSYTYDSPTHPTVRLDSQTKFTTVNLVPPRTHVPPQSLLDKRTIDRMVDRYIVLKTSRKIY